MTTSNYFELLAIYIALWVYFNHFYTPKKEKKPQPQPTQYVEDVEQVTQSETQPTETQTQTETETRPPLRPREGRMVNTSDGVYELVF